MDKLEIQLLNERIKCYRGFSLFLLEKPQENWLKSDLFGQLADAMSMINKDSVHLIEKMAKLMVSTDIQEIEIEYCKLFIGPFSLFAPPYGSVYLDKNHQIMGDSTMKVAHFIENAGIDINSDFNSPPDHFGLELEVMSILGQKLIDAIDQKDKNVVEKLLVEQYNFLQMFLNKSINGFSEKIIEKSVMDFFVSFGKVLQTFISDDINLLKKSIELLRTSPVSAEKE